MLSTDFARVCRAALTNLEARLRVKAAFEISRFDHLLMVWDKDSEELGDEAHPALALKLILSKNPLDANRSGRHFNIELGCIVGLLMYGRNPNDFDISAMAKKALTLSNKSDITDYDDFLKGWLEG